MKRAMLVLATVVGLTGSSTQADEWTKADTAFQVAYSVAHLADMLQTVTIANNPSRFSEVNPILGRHPSTELVVGYFAGTLVLHTAVSAILPQPYRRIWQFVTFGFEVGVVTRNFTLGVGIPL